MFLEAYALSDDPQPLVPAPPSRDWMDAIPGRHAYRCLPLAVANTYGWQLLLPAAVTAEWSGGPAIEDVVVRCGRADQAVSNFSNGIVTFDVGYIFRTAMDFHLLVTGPSNAIKDGVSPLSAVVESDWLPYTFTANYRFTRPGRVHWEAGEPYAQICLIRAGVQERIRPIVRRLDENPQLAADHAAWRERRAELRERIQAGDAAAIRKAWDKDYFLGRYADGRPTTAAHTSRFRVAAPLDERE